MKYFLLFLAWLFILSCNDNNSKKIPETPNTSTPVDSLPQTLSPVNSDSALMKLSESVLKNLKSNNYKAISRLVHPKMGIRFSPYGYIDTILHQRLSQTRLVELADNLEKINWGEHDGTGEPILMTLPGYSKRFVYDSDFINAKEKSVNRSLSSGNSVSNLTNVYPGCEFTEFYFPGFDPKYSGMDWRSLRLVFKKERKEFYLVAIIHDEWTI